MPELWRLCGSVELVKRKRETPEGTCVGQCIGICRFGSIELDGSIELNGSIKPDGGRLLLVENWEVISGDTLGDAGEQRAKVELDGGSLSGLDMMVSRDGFGTVVMTTLGSLMAWRLLRQLIASRLLVR